MVEQFDVIIVGARCAGAPLATLLARRGLDVAVVEQAIFPRDTLSSHLIEADGLAFMDRLGVTERLRATGAPFIGKLEARFDDLRFASGFRLRPDDVGGFASIRRSLLDPILAEAAQDAGAHLRMGAKVVGLVKERGRVAGVRISTADGERELRARLVVGADGRNSTVARLCGARHYNLSPNQKAMYWGYFEGAATGPEPVWIVHGWSNRFVLGLPIDSGLYQVVVFLDLADAPAFRREPERAFLDRARSCEPVGEAISGARRVGKLIGTAKWVGFFREAAGPGWVLLGDAGHFKDPAAGRGIGDAFMQADELAPAIADGLEGADSELDARMLRWGRWRDREFAEHYWFGVDLGKAGPLPAVLPAMIEDLRSKGRLDDFTDLFTHRTRPSEVLTAPRVMKVTAKLVARRGAQRGTVLREVGSLMADDTRRRWLNRFPAYAELRDAGPTEVQAPAKVRPGRDRVRPPTATGA